MATINNIRIIHKHETEANWNKAINFVPQQGELIIYDIDENYDYERFKIGDGQTNVINLPFGNKEEIIIDQSYDSLSENAQSGTAVAEAVSNKSQVQIIIWEDDD